MVDNLTSNMIFRISKLALSSFWSKIHDYNKTKYDRTAIFYALDNNLYSIEERYKFHRHGFGTMEENKQF